jgi:DNA polymerase-3 subunit epsilon
VEIDTIFWLVPKKLNLQESINNLSNFPNHKILSRVPENIPQKSPTGKIFKLAIIDLETTGLNPKIDEIIEIGILITSFTNEDGFIKIDDKINYLNEPKNPISDEVTKITGITNEDVKGQKIDWDLLRDKLTAIDLIICHNAYFDRNFMELQLALLILDYNERGC